MEEPKPVTKRELLYYKRNERSTVYANCTSVVFKTYPITGEANTTTIIGVCDRDNCHEEIPNQLLEVLFDLGNITDYNIPS